MLNLFRVTTTISFSVIRMPLSVFFSLPPHFFPPSLCIINLCNLSFLPNHFLNHIPGSSSFPSFFPYSPFLLFLSFLPPRFFSTYFFYDSITLVFASLIFCFLPNSLLLLTAKTTTYSTSVSWPDIVDYWTRDFIWKKMVDTFNNFLCFFPTQYFIFYILMPWENSK